MCCGGGCGWLCAGFCWCRVVWFEFVRLLVFAVVVCCFCYLSVLAWLLVDVGSAVIRFILARSCAVVAGWLVCLVTLGFEQ